MSHTLKTVLDLIEAFPHLAIQIYSDAQSRLEQGRDTMPLNLAFDQYKKSFQREPLFHDLHGNPIHTGDIFYIVDTQFTILPITATDNQHTPTYYSFKKKEDADQHILKNKPLISYNDLVNLDEQYSEEADLTPVKNGHSEFRFVNSQLMDLLKERMNNAR